jgi:hypothetical protein
MRSGSGSLLRRPLEDDVSTLTYEARLCSNARTDSWPASRTTAARTEARPSGLPVASDPSGEEDGHDGHHTTPVAPVRRGCGRGNSDVAVRGRSRVGAGARGRGAGSAFDPQVRDPAGHPAGDAAQPAASAERRRRRLLRHPSAARIAQEGRPGRRSGTEDGCRARAWLGCACGNFGPDRVEA